VLVLAACATCALAPAAADATHVQCGDVITADTRLDSDLECGGVALSIAASGVTLDLGGHTVSAATPPSASDGIVASAVSGIAVRNGSVHGFAVDISLTGVSGALVRDIVGASTFVEGDGNTVRNQNAAAGIAVRGNANLITSNVVSEPFSPTEAAWVSVSGDDNYITHNVATNVGPTDVDPSAFGLLLRLNRGLVARNVATAAPGWELSSPGATVVGMHLSGLLRAVVRRNEASGHSDGFLLQSPDRFLDNFAFANLDDGIDVDVSGALLARNTAEDNGDYGIEAVPATIDGGHNRARGNGNPDECIGVSCR
jgi:parallel beta helix pectate lyase-like protein